MAENNIGIIGLGFVGGSMLQSFREKNVKVIGYDKFKESDTFKSCLGTDFVFLCLPTLFDNNSNEYDKSIIYEVCKDLENNDYKGLVVIKSTVEPLTTLNLQTKFSKLNFLHNPEFLTAVTAYEDFHNQKHIVLGNCNASNEQLDKINNFYKEFYPNAEISNCSSTESESMKIFCNTFYSVKIQYFNELFFLCQKNKCDYDNIVSLMLKNNWINPMHTKVPGPDGKFSYGGYCFPKDTNALLQHMKNQKVPCELLQSCINERDSMRDDHTNVVLKKETNEKNNDV